MGRAVVIKGVPRLVASPELSRAYNMCPSGSSIVYTHNVTGSTLIFQLDRVRFNDDYFHLPSLLPVLHGDAAASWPMIRAVDEPHEC
jgi:hypothetical protein